MQHTTSMSTERTFYSHEYGHFKTYSPSFLSSPEYGTHIEAEGRLYPSKIDKLALVAAIIQ